MVDWKKLSKRGWRESGGFSLNITDSRIVRFALSYYSTPLIFEHWDWHRIERIRFIYRRRGKNTVSCEYLGDANEGHLNAQIRKFPKMDYEKRLQKNVLRLYSCHFGKELNKNEDECIWRLIVNVNLKTLSSKIYLESWWLIPLELRRLAYEPAHACLQKNRGLLRAGNYSSRWPKIFPAWHPGMTI
jgi:hypothetical protein